MSPAVLLLDPTFAQDEMSWSKALGCPTRDAKDNGRHESTTIYTRKAKIMEMKSLSSSSPKSQPRVPVKEPNNLKN